jgi:O-antigen/teichoic acid export membrane protein
MIRETAAVFGSDSSLIGVISDPPPEQASALKPTIVLLNAGLIHRVGPARLYVRLARAMAARGYVTMRFDLPGRGDSDVRPGAESTAFASFAEVQLAMDYLGAKRGTTRFVLIGICSGAANAVEAAEHDDRVLGAVLINAHAYQTLQSRVRYYLRRLGKASSWKNTLAGRNPLGRKLRNVVSRQKRSDHEMLAANDDTAAVPREAAADVLRRMLGRGVKLFLIYSGGSAYNYRRQFADAFSDVDFGGKVEVAYIPDADHTFTRLSSQERLEREILSWIDGMSSGGGDIRAAESGDDGPGKSGRDRLALNVFWGWVGHFVFITAGFIIPRLIDRRLGQESLGVWDFCWSIVSYFNLAQIGVAASVNRDVAAHRATGQTGALNRTVSSAMAVQVTGAVAVLALTLISVVALPQVFGGRLAAATADARWVVAMLGLTLAVQMALHVFRGVLTGCHRWDLHNQIDAAFHAMAVVGMVAVIQAGAGLPTVAGIILGAQVLAECARAMAAYRVCPELRIRVASVEAREARKLVAFGGKLSVISLAQIAMIQTNNLLVMKSFGVSVLALYARPGALVRHVNTLAQKLSLTLVPTAGSLQSAGKVDDLRSLLEQTTRYAAFMVMPMLFGLALLGGPILQVWMGSAYREDRVLIILAMSSMLPLTQQPAATILIGLNRHGPLALVAVASAAAGIFASVALIPRFGLLGAASSIALASTAAGVAIPVLACRALRMPLGTFIQKVYARPLLAMVPFILTLMMVRTVWRGQPVPALVYGFTLGSLVLVPIYWKWALPPRFHRRIVTLLGSIGLGPRTVPSAAKASSPRARD